MLSLLLPSLGIVNALDLRLLSSLVIACRFISYHYIELVHVTLITKALSNFITFEFYDC